MKKVFFKIALLLIGFFALQCSPDSSQLKNKGNKKTVETETEDIVPVKVISLNPKMITRTLEFVTTFEPYEEVYLAPATPGRIEKILVEPGDKVNKGDLLVRMDPTQYNQLLVQVKNLEVEFKRVDTLYKLKSISQQQYDQIKTQYEVSKTNLEYLRDNVFLKAPFSGVIADKYYKDGELFTSAPNTAIGKPAILYLVNINPLKAYVNVPEKYYPVVDKGIEVTVKADVYPDKIFKGKVNKKYPVVDQTTRSFKTEIYVNNVQGLLRPGMFGRVIMSLSLEKAMVVPAVAILKLQGSNERFLFKEENGIARRVVVQIGQRFDEEVEVISEELKKGDKIIISGQAKLIDGMKVKVVE